MGSLACKKRNPFRSNEGFTLIEILVVIGIIAILAAIVIIAINPARQFALARNSQRVSNVNAILNAVGQRMADNKGIFAGGSCQPLTTSSTTIDSSGGATSGGHLDLATGCLVPTYMPALPNDPSASSTVSTDYVIALTSSGRTVVCAPDAASETAISGATAICVTR